MWPFIASKEVKAFCDAMAANPNDWAQTEYWFIHKNKPELRIWTANGVPFIKIGGNTCLSFADKFCISRAIKKTLALQIGGYLK